MWVEGLHVDISLERLFKKFIFLSPKDLAGFELATIRTHAQLATNLAGLLMESMEWMATYNPILRRGLLMGYVIIIHFQ